MAAGEVCRRREGETAEENETTNVKRRKLEEDGGGIVSHASETSVVIVGRRDAPDVEEECHQIPSVECDLLDSASSSSVSCCSSNSRSEEKSKRRMEEVESCRIKKQKKKGCETVKEAELEDFFQAAEKSLLLESSIKYSFDFEKDEPLCGRYEWVKLNP